MIQATAMNVVTVALMMIIIGFFFRTIQTKMADRPVGQALAYIY